ncbi:TIGR04282 family arsenosugar biosynthesis glycosyltransferase [Orrella daihaiensis]|uniref:TIGR04282 family arsenosugar biosynthesis glycosyltransferase n=1 Tax=Orrella daihaiensis TaxID=2782176 RepID=A0ABY4APQ2_9BURK|nr:TIGR04282 family arsenosugar biosynthesis glycosyltransferase [Orrella daihaiensis]UOD50044.1 TIGR04282 family arsenosugar biosynthesis glycosyltransferase [Orrella daihaiensis]
MGVSEVALIIMAKAPVPGLAKTRLIPALGAEGAASLAKQLLAHTVNTARKASNFSHKELCVTPNTDHSAFADLCLPFTLTDQGEGDLGVRMQRAFERVLEQFDATIMIGTDAPAMTTGLLDQAVDDLANYNAVFVPALDGGYTLIGLKQVLPELFVEIPWSTNQVMAITRERLGHASVHWHEYPPMADIDEPRDLIHLPADWLP